MKSFLWSLAYRSIDTQDKLPRKLQYSSLSPSVCFICLKNEEAIDHLFLHCDFAMRRWILLFRNFGLECCLPSKFAGWMIDGLDSELLDIEEYPLEMCYSVSFLVYLEQEE